MSLILSPTTTPPAGLAAALRDHGHAALQPDGLCTLLGVAPSALQALAPSWNDLPPDAYLRDGGRYRRRRHACFVVEGERIEAVPHRAHWQSLDYNALHGGLERWFEPVAPATLALPAWGRRWRGLGRVASAHKGAQRWYVEAHQFRIDTTDGIGRPTPEGAHRDGVDLVVVSLVGRQHVKGGETRVFEAGGPRGLRFTMTEPWTTLVLDDERVVHETTPIQPLDSPGWRDTLVLTYRRGGFQGPAAT